jgi:uncharacterized membrane protein
VFSSSSGSLSTWWSSRFAGTPIRSILLNLVFSTQAAYAAPLILLAQTRQADRDRISDTALSVHREQESAHARQFEQRQAEQLAQERELAEQHSRMLDQNTRLTRQVAHLTEDLHTAIIKDRTGSPEDLPFPKTPSDTA